MWQASVSLDGSDWTLGLRLVSLISVSDQVVLNPFVILTALFVLEAYKYVVVGSKGVLLVI
jgi:hypothetical protein